MINLNLFFFSGLACVFGGTLIIHLPRTCISLYLYTFFFCACICHVYIHVCISSTSVPPNFGCRCQTWWIDQVWKNPQISTISARKATWEKGKKPQIVPEKNKTNLSKIAPTEARIRYPRLPQTRTKKETPSETVGEGSGVFSTGIWEKSLNLSFNDATNILAFGYILYNWTLSKSCQVVVSSRVAFVQLAGSILTIDMNLYWPRVGNFAENANHHHFLTTFFTIKCFNPRSIWSLRADDPR